MKKKIDKVIQWKERFIDKSTLYHFSSTKPSSGPWAVILAMLSQQWMFKMQIRKPRGNLNKKKKLAVHRLF